MRTSSVVASARWVAGLSFILLAACGDEPPTGPRADAGTGGPPQSHLGVVEITISGIGDGQPTTSVRSVRNPGDLSASTLPNGIGASLAPAPGGDGTIQLEPLSTGSFTDGERGGAGVRYVWATYRVRNARADGTPYDTPRQNLTFLAVATDGTIGETAISRLDRFDGSPANSAIAAQILPTGAVTRDLLTGAVVSAGPDVLQVLTEEEVEELNLPEGVNDVFPYGFVVRREAETSTRTLPANPDEDQFDGIVTFAFKIPLQATAAEDPFTVSAVFLVVDDDETRITQSLEEQTPEAQAAFEARAAALGATKVHLLYGGAYSGAIASSQVCSARTAGTKATPATSIGQHVSLLSLAPNSGKIAKNSSFTATFTAPVSGVDHTTFSVAGSVSGQAFVGQAYDGNGTETITTPAGNFSWSEKVQVVIDGLECVSGLPYSLELDVVPEPFSTSLTFTTGNMSAATITADVNDDGRLDVVVLNLTDMKFVTVLDVDGTMETRSTVATSTGVMGYGMAIGDVNGDGMLDVVVAGRTPNSQSLAQVYLGNGDGTFEHASNVSVGDGPQYVALGDLNGDGRLDLATANLDGENFSVALGNGDGTFGSVTHRSVGGQSYYVGFADLDEDGKLDVIVEGLYSGLFVYWGNGAGGFDGPTSIMSGSATAAVIGDFNGDGHLDVLASTSLGDVVLFPGTGTRTFGSPRTVSLPGAMVVLYGAAADLDGDGDLDLAVSAFDDNYDGRMYILLNDGTGSFSLFGYRALGATDLPTIVGIADVNGDGKPDIVTSAEAYPGTVYVFWNS